MTTNSDWTGEVCHSTSITWELDANGSRVNLNVHRGDLPHSFLIELVDPRLAADFDDNWVVDIEYRYNEERKLGTRRTFRHGQLSTAILRISSWSNPILEWRMTRRDVHPFKSRFIDQTIAVKHGNEHQITLTSDNNTVVYVNQDLISLDSPFFTKLFAENQNSPNLDDVTAADFLDFVYCVHPPILQLTAARIENVMKLAMRFENKTLLKTCKSFLEHHEPQSAQEKSLYLYCADEHEMPGLFLKTLKGMTMADLRYIDPARAATFQVMHTQELLKKFIKTICPFELEHLKSAISQHARHGFLLLFFGFFLFIQAIVSIIFEKARESWKTFTSPHRFLWNRRLAIEKGFDCIIYVEGEVDRPLFVKKAILATNSEFFKTLFYGKFEESGKSTVRLGGLTVDELLDYLKCVYSAQSSRKEEFTYKRIATILRLADRFRNESLLASCEEMLGNAICEDPKDSVHLLEWADEHKMPKIFEAVAKSLKVQDLPYVNIATAPQFNEEDLCALFHKLVALVHLYKD